MAILALKVLDQNGKTICVSRGEDYVSLVCMAQYQEGDRIVLETSEKNLHVWLQVDDAMGASLCYVTDHVSYQIPFGAIVITYMQDVPGKMKSRLTEIWL